LDILFGEEHEELRDWGGRSCIDPGLIV
jgi:hypothetical protein